MEATSTSQPGPEPAAGGQITNKTFARAAPSMPKGKSSRVSLCDSHCHITTGRCQNSLSGINRRAWYRPAVRRERRSNSSCAERETDSIRLGPRFVDDAVTLIQNLHRNVDVILKSCCRAEERNNSRRIARISPGMATQLLRRDSCDLMKDSYFQ